MQYSKFFRPLVAAHNWVLLTAILSLPFLFDTVAVAGGRNDDTVRVMTRNMYFGADLAPVIAAGSLPELLAATTAAYESIVVSSEPAERAATIAREIVRHRVDLVGLQEVTIVRKGPLTLPPITNPASEVVVEGLQHLLRALEKLGEPYQVVAILPGFDVELPTLLNLDGRLTLRDVILARKRSADLKLSNVQVQGFLVNRSFPTAFGPILNARGWLSVDVEKAGRKFRFANTHLENLDFSQTPQANDMINGAGNTTLPVVFVGDFNIRADDPGDPTYPVYQKFIDAGFVDAWALKRPDDPGFTFGHDADLLNPVPHLSERIDLVLIRGGFGVADIRLVGDEPDDRTPSGLWPSDHAGVVATLRIPRAHIASSGH